jgi:hypothetical protein
MKPNIDLRFYAQRFGVPLWKIARAYGYSEPTLYRNLRSEFDESGKAKFRQIVDRLAQEGKE